jgi:hypothetical protein
MHITFVRTNVGGPRGVPRFVNGWGDVWLGSQILVYYSMGKTFKATVDWLGMVENGGSLPGQDEDPSVSGEKAQMKHGGGLKKFQATGQFNFEPLTSETDQISNQTQSIRNQQEGEEFIMTRFQDLTDLTDYEFSDKYATSKHAVKMDTDPEYASGFADRGDIGGGTVSSYYEKFVGNNPNSQWISGAANQTYASPEQKEQTQNYHNEAIGMALPLPLLEGINLTAKGSKLPGLMQSSFALPKVPTSSMPFTAPKVTPSVLPYDKGLRGNQRGQIIPQQHMTSGRHSTNSPEAINHLYDDQPQWFAPIGDTRYIDRSIHGEIPVPGLGKQTQKSVTDFIGNTGKKGFDEFPLTDAEKLRAYNGGYNTKLVDGELVVDYNNPIMRTEGRYENSLQNKIEGVFNPDSKIKVIDGKPSNLGHSTEGNFDGTKIQKYMDEGYDIVQVVDETTGQQLENILLPNSKHKFKVTGIDDMPVHIDNSEFKLGGALPRFQTTGEFDKEGNYMPYTVDPKEYSTTNPSGQRSEEMNEIDEFFEGSLNSPIYKKRLGLQGNIRDVGNENLVYHPDHGTISREEAVKLNKEWYNDDQYQPLRIDMPFQEWDSDEKNTSNQTIVDETVANRKKALNTMTTDYSSEYDNKLYEKVHYVSNAVTRLAEEAGLGKKEGGGWDMSEIGSLLENHPQLREDFKWAFAPKSDQSDKWLGSHSDTAPHLNKMAGYEDMDGKQVYLPNERKVSMQMTPSQIQNMAEEAGITYEEMEARTYAHEVGHSLGAVYDPGYTGYGVDYGPNEYGAGAGAGRFPNQNYSINNNEAELMRQMMRENYGVNVSGGDKTDEYVKDDTYARGATEAKADLDAVRYDMHKQGVYDYRKGDIDQKTLDKYLSKYKGENGEIDMEAVPLDLKRTLERYQERDLIFLNNNVADASEEIGGGDLPPVMNAKYGGALPMAQEGWMDTIRKTGKTIFNPIGSGIDFVKNQIADNIHPIGYNGRPYSGGAFNRVYNAIMGNGNYKELAGDETEVSPRITERKDLLHMLMGLEQENNSIPQQTQYNPSVGHNEGDTYYSSPVTEQQILEKIKDIGVSQKDTFYKDYGEGGKYANSIDSKNLDKAWQSRVDDMLEEDLFDKFYNNDLIPAEYNGKKVYQDYQKKYVKEGEIYYKDLPVFKEQMKDKKSHNAWKKEQTKKFNSNIYNLDDILTGGTNKERIYGKTLGDFKVEKGEDEKGTYISYYDKWDLSPYGGEGGWREMVSDFAQDNILNVKPPSLYNRMYYTQDEEGNYKFKNGGSLPKAQPGTELAMCSNGEWNGRSVKTACGNRESAHNLYGTGALTIGDISEESMSGSARVGLGYSTHVPYSPLTGHAGISAGTRLDADEQSMMFNPILDATASVGIEGEFGGNSHKWREPWKYGAGIYGKKDLTGNNGVTAGLYGNLGILSGKIGYSSNGGLESSIGANIDIRKDGGEGVSERDKFIQFLKDNEGGADYIRNKNSAIKKIGEDNKWDGESYHKIYDEASDMHYPHYVNDEKSATIGYGHHNKDVFKDYPDGISGTKADELLGIDADKALSDTEIWWNSKYKSGDWEKLDASTQYLLADIGYNVGHIREFPKFANAINTGDFEKAESNYKRYDNKVELGRNKTYMEEYLKPWLDIEKEKVAVAPAFEDMPLPIGVHPIDGTLDTSDPFEELRYGGQHNWALDRRPTTRAKKGTEVKNDSIYSNDRYSSNASKYKRILPKYQNK